MFMTTKPWILPQHEQSSVAVLSTINLATTLNVKEEFSLSNQEFHFQ